jgi:hypothetical protein
MTRRPQGAEMPRRHGRKGGRLGDATRVDSSAFRHRVGRMGIMDMVRWLCNREICINHQPYIRFLARLLRLRDAIHA